MIDEVMRKSISNALWHKLQTNKHFSIAPEHQDAPNPALPIPGDDNRMSFQDVMDRASVGGNVDDGLKQSRMRS